MAKDIRRVPLGELLERHPGWGSVLEEFGIDGRTGTAISLAAAAERVGVDVDVVVAAFSGPPRDRWECRSIDQAPPRALIRHIEQAHHELLRHEFPRITVLIEQARRNRPDDDRLAELAGTFADLRADMEPHLVSEETILFPLCRDLIDAFSWPSFHSGPVSNPIDTLRHDHDHAGSLLDELDGLMATAADGSGIAAGTSSGDPRDAELFDAIRSLAGDLRRHLTEEDSLLFPRVLELASELNEA